LTTLKVCEGPSTALSSRRPSVVIADESTVAREGLVAIIQRDLGYTVCGLAIDESATRGARGKASAKICLSLNHFLAITTGFFFSNNLLRVRRAQRRRVTKVTYTLTVTGSVKTFFSR
jgi:hypothetical protein